MFSATPKVLNEHLATATGHAWVTVDARYRTLRLANLLTPGGRGKGVARLDFADAAKIIIAVMAADTAAEGEGAVDRYFHLPLVRYINHENSPPDIQVQSKESTRFKQFGIGLAAVIESFKQPNAILRRSVSVSSDELASILYGDTDFYYGLGPPTTSVNHEENWYRLNDTMTTERTLPYGAIEHIAAAFVWAP